MTDPITQITLNLGQTVIKIDSMCYLLILSGEANGKVFSELSGMKNRITSLIDNIETSSMGNKI